MQEEAIINMTGKLAAKCWLWLEIGKLGKGFLSYESQSFHKNHKWMWYFGSHHCYLRCSVGFFIEFNAYFCYSSYLYLCSKLTHVYRLYQYIAEINSSSYRTLLNRKLFSNSICFYSSSFTSGKDAFLFLGERKNNLLCVWFWYLFDFMYMNLS